MGNETDYRKRGIDDVMNIQSVKEELKNTVKMYLTKNQYGEYDVPSVRQRPMLIIGAPGIGKTAIVAQVAEEMHLGYVSYTITHHTRQSAIGLPFVKQKTYGGKEVSVTEYTLSEIVDSVYRAVEEQKQPEGILFIDEINCVSETLAPAMLELLQNKKFGPHKIPKGWVLVAAGNPPEYNKSVKEFDIVTLDRVKRVEAEPSFEVWKKYAYDSGVHSAVTYYLGLKPQNLFTVQKSVDGVDFVTPRGWEDLSVAIKMYEKLGFEVTQELVEEYVQSYEIATEFFRCYLLTNKYKTDYDVDRILSGETETPGASRLSAAPFDERLAVIEVLSGGVNARASSAQTAIVLERAVKALYSTVNMMEEGEARAYLTERCETLLAKASRSSVEKEREADLRLVALLKEILLQEDLYLAMEKAYTDAGERRAAQADAVTVAVESALSFTEKTFGKGQELVALVVGLVSAPQFVAFLARNACPKFMQYNEMLLTDRQNKQLLLEIKKLED